MDKVRNTSLAMVVAISALGPASAVSAAPDRAVTAIDMSTDICGFEVHAVGTSQEVTRTVDTARGTRTILTFPQSRVTLSTPASPGVSLTLAVTGPALQTVRSDGSQTWAQVGPWVHFAHPETGAPGLYATRGRVLYASDADGQAPVELKGRLIDLCAELAT